MQFKQTGDFILNKLRKELPAHLSYHGIAHVEDVYQAAERIAKEEGISKYEQKLLLTAALFHDSGFIKMREGHEAESCKIAHRYLPAYNYRPDEIELICGMIMATRIPQSPQTRLEEILCDADLDYLGRADFFILSCRLFAELQAEGIIKDEEEWDRQQETFMEGHRYQTATSIKLRQPKKAEYIKLVKSKI
ncbi:MAG TPA: HD domain-containing protein [Mucilaginibacter sp.]|nr:HD domain-containing protein [Mucilaginibacter sp.]